MLVATLILMSAVAAIQAIDVAHSVRGFAAGYVERNPIIEKLFGLRPAAWQIVLVNTATLLLFAAPALASRNAGIWGAGMGLLTGLAGKHIFAIHEWHRLGF